MSMRPSMKPTGWFQVAWSSDLAPGDVIPLHYFGQDLVAYRDFRGEVHVHDATCQHSGPTSDMAAVSPTRESGAPFTAGSGDTTART